MLSFISTHLPVCATTNVVLFQCNFQSTFTTRSKAVSCKL